MKPLNVVAEAERIIREKEKRDYGNPGHPIMVDWASNTPSIADIVTMETQKVGATWPRVAAKLQIRPELTDPMFQPPGQKGGKMFFVVKMIRLDPGPGYLIPVMVYSKDEARLYLGPAPPEMAKLLRQEFRQYWWAWMDGKTMVLCWRAPDQKW